MQNKFLILSYGFILLGLSYAAPCYALDLSFNVDSSIDAISGMGLVMSSSGSKTYFPVTIEEKKESKNQGTKVSFSIPDVEVPHDGLASVVLFSSDGDLAFSKIRSITALTLPKLPACSKKDTVVLDAQNQVGVIQSLVSIRTARRENAKKKIDIQLTPEYIETLTKLEKGFGLQSTPALNSELPPEILADRLARILHAIRNYRSAKKSAN